MKSYSKSIVLGVATALVLCAGAARAADEPKLLNIYNGSDYIAEDTIKNFEKETGIKVNYDNYDNYDNYANPNAASMKWVKKDVADNKTSFLSEADKSA